jgi:uracil-DNA glycosylase family 4
MMNGRRGFESWVKQPSIARTITTPVDEASGASRQATLKRCSQFGLAGGIEEKSTDKNDHPVGRREPLKWQTLQAAEAEALGCIKCGLSAGRTQVVWLDGNVSSDLMLIGEAPGYHEDKQGKPFVGAAGQLLDNLLAGIGLNRTNCVICNVLKCRPPGNRDPQPDEIETCSPYLEAQIHFIRPRIIVTLGNFATRFLLKKQLSISRLRGVKVEAYGAIVIPTFHPASALHSGGPGSPAMAALRSDFALIKQELLKARVPVAEPVPAAPLAHHVIEQGSLF